jgi:hypothetical protein
MPIYCRRLFTGMIVKTAWEDARCFLWNCMNSPPNC